MRSKFCFIPLSYGDQSTSLIGDVRSKYPSLDHGIQILEAKAQFVVTSFWHCLTFFRTTLEMNSVFPIGAPKTSKPEGSAWIMSGGKSASFNGVREHKTDFWDAKYNPISLAFFLTMGNTTAKSDGGGAKVNCHPCTKTAKLMGSF